MAFLGSYFFTFCQSARDIQNPVFGVHYILNDFNSAQAIRASSLSTALRNKEFGRFNKMSQGLALNYITGLHPYFDLSSTITGSFPDLPAKNSTQTGKGSLLIELDASVRARLFSNKYRVTPYLQAGLGGAYYKGNLGAFVPAGVGLQAEILTETFLLVNAQYRIGIADKTRHHFFYGIGLAGTIGKKKSIARASVLPPLPAPPLDSDGDGIFDSVDLCPQVKGLAIYKGCPDFDSDSIPDKDDKCPFVKGVLRYQGCPIPDTDGDGIHDEADKCPTVKGIAAYEGCPPPDADKDGIPDDKDHCPELPGTVNGNGCPEIAADIKNKVKLAAQHIFFASGKATLLPTSYRSLDEVVRIMAADTLIKIDIEGHTDNIGTVASNLLLSQQRAATVRNYFVTKGIPAERFSASGYGEDKPIADNKTESGRKANRRVVLQLRYQ